MEVIYDAQIFLDQKTGGISRYHYELLKGVRRNGHNARIAGLFVKNHYLLSDSQCRKSLIPDPIAAFAGFNRWILKRCLKRISSGAIFHPTNAYSYLYPEVFSVKHKVFTIHDMILEKQNISTPPDKLLYAKNASKIIAVSEATKQDIVKLWDINRAKIEVIYHGSSLSPQQAVKPAQPAPDSFVLYVGDRGGHKNFLTFVKAIAGLLKKQRELYLVCAGKRPFSATERLLLKELGVAHKAACFASVTDNELSYLYCNAKAFVFPSLHEGFGIPILEAWSCGAPVVLSRHDCFTEVAAEAGRYFDPLSAASIREEVERVLLDKPLRDDLVKKGASRLKLFSWEKSVKQTCNLYQSLL
ncbi:MAG: glycosyltransferase family 4 protein [Prevotellaceae bacterium]|jgi:glycosyltransferase involved in cell wall biosynthesis|nr:glycosyltransferase family 4 protein [Prevotellaceae bacterium]